MFSGPMDLSNVIPMSAVSVRFTYTISPASETVLLKRTPEDSEPLLLSSPRGNVDIQFLVPQKLFVEHSAETVFRISISGYGF